MSMIELRNVSIAYKTIKARSLKNLFSAKEVSYTNTAIDDVSMTIERGEIVGLIGRNGSGKSTLLRALAGIFVADKGEILVNSTSVSLLALGVGFQEKLSGVDNIFLSALLLGFSKKEVDEKVQEIIEFSELGEAIKKPVKSYSTGMRSKLAFAITAIMEPDVILIDEVISVGDRRFRKKSLRKMKELISHKDRTVVIVSHNLSTIGRLCKRVAWLDNGKLMRYGSGKIVIRAYKRFMDSEDK